MASKLNLKNLSLADFKEAPYNPRTITKDALSRLDKSIEFHGDLSAVTLNAATGLIVSGHQRLKTARGKKTKIVTSPAKDNHGTVAVGYIEVYADKGVIKIPLRVVDWDKRTEKLANIAANAHGGEFDNQKLGKLLAELDTRKFDIELTGLSDGKFQTLVQRSLKPSAKSSGKYVQTLASPIYKVTGKKPKLSAVYDTSKSDELKEAISNAHLPRDVAAFLTAAADRHTKFRFDLAAEYYAHAPKNVQQLMEDCALVIVDYNKAIEHGYLKLTDGIMEMVKDAN